MKEHNCDILVIGGGGSGLVAAVRARELSGKKVMVLESGKMPGGGMMFASTMRTFHSRWQQERNIPDQANDFIRKGMDLTLWKLNPKLVTRAVLGTGAFFDWYYEKELPEIQAKYEARPYVFDIPVQGQPGPQIDGFHNGSGKYIVNTMVRQCQEQGIDILLNHRAVDAQVEDGKITAILAETPEGLQRFCCKICILSCSSWIKNQEVVEKVYPAFAQAEVLPNAHQNPNYRGDGLTIAQKAGAFIDWSKFCLRVMGPICSFTETSPFDALTHADCGILVNLKARRFVAEPMAPRMDPFDTGHVLLQQPKGRSFFLFSKNTLQWAIEDSRRAAAVTGPNPFGMPALPDLEVVDGWFTEKLDKGSHEVGRADTLGELARQMGLDPEQLEQTVAEYNASCAQGMDWNFYKDPKHMIPLTDAPFYAVGCKLSTDGAFGGVTVDENMQALRPDGSRVEGLYVTGDFANGRHIVMDGVKKQVLNDMSWALSSGFIAGTAVGQAAR